LFTSRSSKPARTRTWAALGAVGRSAALGSVLPLSLLKRLQSMLAGAAAGSALAAMSMSSAGD
jgi:hypothetical protein